MSLKEKIEKMEAELAAAKAELAKKTKDDPKVIAKAAFDAIDTDKSGFIDLKEFQQLSVVLDTPLDEKEIEEIVSALDQDDDGKISFKEFYDWFSKEDKKDTKDANKLAIIKTKVQLHIAQKKTNEFFKALKDAADAEEKKLVEKKDKDQNESPFSQIRFCLKSGNVKPDVALSLKTRFEDVEENIVTVVFKTKTDTSKDDVDALMKTLEPYTGMLGMFGAELEHELKDDKLVFKVALPMDPLAMAAQMGIDLAQLLDTFKVELEFGARNTGKFEVDIKIKKAMLQALQHMPTVPLKVRRTLVGAAALNKINFEVSVGDLAASLGDDLLTPKIIGALDNGLKKWAVEIQNEFCKKFAFPQLVKALDQKADDVYEFLTKNVHTLSSVELASQSGVKVTFLNSGLFDLTQAPSLDEVKGNLLQ